MLHARLGFAAVAVVTLAALVLVPVALVSMVDDAMRLNDTHLLWRSTATTEPRAALLVEVTKLDEVGREVTLRLSGYFLCGSCAYQEQLTLYSIPTRRPGIEGVPPSKTIKLPSGGQTIAEEVTLPLYGSLFRYPFDSYPLTLGISAERVRPSGELTAEPPSEGRAHLTLALRNEAPRVNMQPPGSRDLADAPVSGVKREYLAVYDLTFERPGYLKIVVPLVVLLIAAAAALAVLLRPFDQLVLNSGALVLGVWGIRGLVLGGFPPNVTAVDQVLTGVIVFMLGAIAVRALTHLHGVAELDLLPWDRRKQRGAD